MVKRLGLDAGARESTDPEPGNGMVPHVHLFEMNAGILLIAAVNRDAPCESAAMQAQVAQDGVRRAVMRRMLQVEEPVHFNVVLPPSPTIRKSLPGGMTSG